MWFRVQRERSNYDDCSSIMDIESTFFERKRYGCGLTIRKYKHTQSVNNFHELLLHNITGKLPYISFV